VTGVAGRTDAVLPLAQTVIDGGYCIGCGACAVAAPDAFSMAMDETGRWQAQLSPSALDGGVDTSAICPFGERSLDEDQLAERYLETASLTHDPAMGYFSDIWTGSAPDEFRDVGSSGGLASWFAAALLERGLVDGVAHVLPNGEPDEPLVTYRISTSADQIRRGGKSHYHSVELSSVVRQMKEQGGRYLVVGVPCFVKAVRNLALQDAQLRAQVAYTAAIFCGHMKSSGYGELLGWQMAIPPNRLEAVSFREKLMDRPANRYGTKATSRDGLEILRPSSDFAATDWGLGYFKFQACDFCDDISGETADISFGDAWLPRFTADPRGTSLVICRSRELSEIFSEAADAGVLSLERLSQQDALASQDANFRHRREGLAYRLADARRAGLWAPPKRVVTMARHLTRRERRRFDMRSTMSARSHQAFARAKSSGDLQSFEQEMAPLVGEYRALTSRRVLDAGMRRFRRLLTRGRRRGGFLRTRSASALR
jgi:coenzyme F420 hydrogenase subunit beta